ncbi:MAG: helix-turn-helix domain-containing protein [Bacteroidales bacterium]|nr:helix-turn-helix domain-containing protein [Bacteroidales bacterium]
MPLPLEEKLKNLGQRIRLARLRRKLPMEILAQRASCSPVTLGKIENGDPTVSMGAYARVLFGMRLEKELDRLIETDLLGQHLTDAALINTRAPKRKTPKKTDAPSPAPNRAASPPASTKSPTNPSWV